MSRSTALLVCALGAGVLTAGRAAVVAHKTVVSQYTFNRDVRPILERRCVECHATGSTLPLQTYDEAKAQSWPLRQTLIAGRMPPYYAEPGEIALKDPQTLTPRELDVLMTWASGGTPEGAPAPPREGRAAPRLSDAATTSPEDARRETLTVTAKGTSIERSLRIVAVRSIRGPAGTRVRLVAVGADGSRRQLVDVRVEPAWPRRYEFVHPITLPEGSRIEADVNPASDVWFSLLGGPKPPLSTTEFSVEFEVVS